MKTIPEEARQFFEEAGFGVISTADKEGRVHSSVKGMLHCDAEGVIYIADLYRQRTLRNLKENPYVSIAVVDEHRFKGYVFEGSAQIIEGKEAVAACIDTWHEALARRMATRVIRNVRGGTGRGDQPEARLPDPEYLIKVTVEKVIDLVPKEIRSSDT
ncbi:MAG: pyridoxamine 5'-phosphate oxidase family protein [Candidatus Omnitrophica bacterium]|nr:pyridoxamine 5'-phosphate oxidase family protein [Candidatus Omnitrophota bacterium]